MTARLCIFIDTMVKKPTSDMDNHVQIIYSDGCEKFKNVRMQKINAYCIRVLLEGTCG